MRITGRLPPRPGLARPICAARRHAARSSQRKRLVKPCTKRFRGDVEYVAGAREGAGVWPAESAAARLGEVEPGAAG